MTTETSRGQAAAPHPPLGSGRRLWRVLLLLLVGALVVALPVPTGLTTEAWSYCAFLCVGQALDHGANAQERAVRMTRRYVGRA